MHREDCLPRVGRWVNQFHGSATSDCHCEGWLPFNGTRKDEADRWERPAYLISPRGSVVEALGVCGKGLQRTAWEPLADFGVLLIACPTCSGTCNVAYLPWQLSPISPKSLLLVFKNEYLGNADHAHGRTASSPLDR